MALIPGSRIGAYEIVDTLGSGGMGEVYRARDPRLKRDVALKVLPAGIAADPDVRRRFEREAQSVAALNHPNIVTIYSVEESAGVPFLTLEVVQGRTLSELIPEGGFPLERLLGLAVPLADAVSFAHQRGILHRDLKPANVMITTDDRVKVLDFGLAKLVELDPVMVGVVQAQTGTLTGEGRILGTAAYMSPEQAEGHAIDHRSDIFSLGVMLYEMATGERPFKGDTAMAIISSILSDAPPPVTEVNPAMPKDLGRIIRRCLVKDPEHRYQTAKDVRNELRELRQDLDSGELTAVADAPRISQSRHNLVGIGVAGAAFFLAAAWVAWRGGAGRTSAPGAPLTGRVTQLTTQQGIETNPSLSPDGRWLVYSAPGPRGDTDVFLQSVGGRTPINLTPDSPDADSQPAFSPDGDLIAFRSGRQGGGIFVMGRTGESARRVTDVGFNPAWSPDGKELVFATVNIAGNPFSRGTFSELWIVDVASGQRRRVTAGDAVQPAWSPHGHRIAYWALPANSVHRDIFTVAAGGGDPVPVTNDVAVDWSPLWSPDGASLYFGSNRGGVMSLWRVAIDEQSGRPLGEPQPITTPSTYAGMFTRSADGRRLAYVSTVADTNVYRVAFDPVAEAIASDPSPVTRGSVIWLYLDVSPDGSSIAVSPAIRQEDVYIGSSDGTGGLRQVTDDPSMDRWPRWSPDGSQVLFYTTRSGPANLWLIRPDGSGARPLTTASTHMLYPVWSPDGKRVAYTELATGAIHIIDPARQPDEQPADTVPPFENGLTVMTTHWSPDGSKLALLKNGIVAYSFERQAYERLTTSGSSPRWLSDSRRIVFSEGNRLRLLDSSTRDVKDLLTLDRQTVGAVAVTRDDRWVYFLRGVNEADIYLIEFASGSSR